MDVLLWVLLGITVWLAAGFALAWVLGRTIALRDRYSPRPPNEDSTDPEP